MLRIIFCCLLVSVFCCGSTFAQINLEQLVDLYVLQKEFHADKASALGQEFLSQHAQILKDAEVQVTEEMAPFWKPEDRESDIPYILFKPKNPNPGQPQPLILHTHGGPQVRFEKNTPHAEIAYFLSHGFIVACPNYRGSSGAEAGSSLWNWWLGKAEGKYHVIGPEDIYSVAKHLLGSQNIQKDKIFLRGGSFGSHINSHFLAAIKKAKFPISIAGAHLSGGVNYPTPQEMPENIPVLISHGALDQVAPFKDAQLFMEKLLFRFSRNPMPAMVQTFVASRGDHHLIDPALQYLDKSSPSYRELVSYLKTSTDFILNIALKRSSVGRTAQQQLESLSSISPGIQARLKQYHAFSDLSRNAKTASQEKGEDYLKYDSWIPDHSPTAAHMKLVLKDEYTGNIRKDLTTFFEKHFKPVDWTGLKTPLTDAGDRILKDSKFFDQIVSIAQSEQEFLSQHPDHLVLIHTALSNSVHLYSFIQLWREILETGIPSGQIRTISRMRMFDHKTADVTDIHDFLKIIGRNRSDNKPDEIFNNLPGFQDRAIACNVPLTGSPHSTASCSVWWHFDGKDTGDRTPFLAVVEQTLNLLGIFSPERLQRYKNLFETEKKAAEHLGHEQTLLQQIFIPYSEAKKNAYVCQIWREQINRKYSHLSQPEIFKDFCQNPIQFEKGLRNQTQAFTNFGDLPGYGNVDSGFLYFNLLQIRSLLSSNSVTYRSFLRYPQLFESFIEKLQSLIIEDYTDFLGTGRKIPDFIFKSSHSTDKIEEISDEVLIELQKDIENGFVPKPDDRRYQIWEKVSYDQKARVQEALSKINPQYGGNFYLYSVTRYLKGYTYFDLLKEAIESVFRDDRKNHDFMMEQIRIFGNPESAKKTDIDRGHHDRLRGLCYDIRDEYRFNPEKHVILRTDEAYPNELFRHTLRIACEAFLKYSYFAAEGHF